MEYFFLKKTVFPLVYPSKHSSWWRRTEGVLKTSWRHNCKTSCKLVLKTSWRRLENILKTSCRTSWKRFRKTYRKYVLKTSSRRLGRRKVLRWRRLGKQEMFAGTNLNLRDNFLTSFSSSHPEVFLGKGVLKICSKFTGEHPWQSAISIKLFCNIIEITLQHGYSPVNLLHIFRTPFLKNTSGRLLLIFLKSDMVLGFLRTPDNLFQRNGPWNNKLFSVLLRFILGTSSFKLLVPYILCLSWNKPHIFPGILFLYNFRMTWRIANILNFQQPTISWKLFSGSSINAVMTAQASIIAEYGYVTISSNFAFGSGITQHASTNSVWKD